LLRFTTGTNNTSATIYINKTSDGSGFVYADDIMVQQFDSESVPPVVNDDWSKEGGALVTDVENGVLISGGYSGYLPQTYLDETISFDLETDLAEGAAWPAISIRYQNMAEPL